MTIVNNMTQAFVNTAKCPEGRTKQEWVDASTPGLYLLCSSSGKVSSFFYRVKQNGRMLHTKLGRSADMNLAQARAAVKKCRAERTLGLHQGTSNQAPMPTFSAFFEDTVLPRMKDHNRSWRRSEILYRLRIKPVFGDLPLDQINRQMVARFHADLLHKEGLSGATADHHAKLMRRTYSIAVEYGVISQNPLSKFKLFNHDNRVDHCLSEADLAKLVAALQAEKSQTVPLLAFFLLATGARLNEALKATWSQIDREAKIWRVPSSYSKSGRIRNIVLNEVALDTLEKLGTEGKADHLFWNFKTNSPIVSVHKRWDLIRKRIGMPWLRIHDLRHTFASMLLNSGRSLFETQVALGHQDPKVTMRYAHLSSKTMQDAADCASVKIKAAMPKEIA